MTQLKRSLHFVLFSFLIFNFVACDSIPNNSQGNFDEDMSDKETFHPYDVNKYALNKLICDPMGGGNNPGANDGLLAHLYYLAAGQQQYDSVSEYIELGIQSSQTMFFSDLNIPTRKFDMGFPTQTGDLVKDDQGQVLNEYFAIRFQSVLKLSENDIPGEYELALLSDDGSIMRINDADGVPRVVVDNDHDHPTKMGCGDTISIGVDSEFDVQIDYYQGPRYHISMIPMWRRVDSSTQSEPNCGREGNEMYFDYNNNSQPQNAYINMLNRGWRPIAAENWHLPPSAIFNPCTEGQIPIISNLSISYLGEGVVLATWNTDIPATSQVLYTDNQTGEEFITTSDNVLRTQHRVVVNQGLAQGHSYTMQAVSISADMGKVLSRFILVDVQ